MKAFRATIPSAAIYCFSRNVTPRGEVKHAPPGVRSLRSQSIQMDNFGHTRTHREHRPVPAIGATGGHCGKSGAGQAPMAVIATLAGGALHEHGQGIFQDGFQLAEKFSPQRTVNHTVIGGQ